MTDILFEPGRQDIVVSRVFAAPCDVVFKAFTDPQLIPRWWGSSRFTTSVDQMDVRRGGQWRFITRSADSEYAFRGVYHSVEPSSSVVYTFEYEQGGPGYLQLVTESFVPVSGGTRYVNVALFQSVEDRDGWIPTDMDKGISESMDLMAELLQ